MSKKIYVQHQGTKLVEKIYDGFCWSFLFFGIIVPVCRGDLSASALYSFLIITFNVFLHWLFFIALSKFDILSLFFQNSAALLSIILSFFSIISCHLIGSITYNRQHRIKILSNPDWTIMS